MAEPFHDGGVDRREPECEPIPASNPHKALVIENPDVFAVCIEQSVALKFGEHPAHCFELDPQIAADFLACHAQVKFSRRIPAHSQAVRQIQQERRHPLFGGHRAEQFFTSLSLRTSVSSLSNCAKSHGQWQA
jgi:hypothetical protein